MNGTAIGSLNDTDISALAETFDLLAHFDFEDKKFATEAVSSSAVGETTSGASQERSNPKAL